MGKKEMGGEGGRSWKSMKERVGWYKEMGIFFFFFFLFLFLFFFPHK